MTSEQLEGMEDPVKTAVGFGGKTFDRLIEIDDTLYLLMKCEVTSDGRAKTKKAKADGYTHKAGAKTTILAELTESEATAVVAELG